MKLQCETQVPKGTGDLVQKCHEMSRDTLSEWRLVHLKGFASFTTVRLHAAVMLYSFLAVLGTLPPRPSAASVAGTFGENRVLP